MFEHGIVDRNRRATFECRLRQPGEIEVTLAFRKRLPAGRKHRGLQALDLGQEHAGGEVEHAAVPEIAALREETLSARDVGLFNEAGDRAARRVAWQRTAAGDVSVARLCPTRPDAKGDEMPSPCSGNGSEDLIPERVPIGDQVIGWQGQHQALRILGNDAERSNGQGRGRVSANWLEDDVARDDPDLLQLLCDQEAMLVVREDRRRTGVRQPDRAKDRGLQQAVIAMELQELLRKRLTRQRPQTCTGTAGQDHGMDAHGDTSDSDEYMLPQSLPCRGASCAIVA